MVHLVNLQLQEQADLLVLLVLPEMQEVADNQLLLAVLVAQVQTDLLG